MEKEIMLQKVKEQYRRVGLISRGKSPAEFISLLSMECYVAHGSSVAPRTHAEQVASLMGITLGISHYLSTIVPDFTPESLSQMMADLHQDLSQNQPTTTNGIPQ